MPPSLAKRLLFHAAPDDPLPQLLSSPNVHHELTPELYDFIALSLRAYVSPWWSKISRYDKDFLPHITRILIHVVQALDDRIQNADMSELAYNDLPILLTQHWRDYRNMQAKVLSAYASGGSTSGPILFAHLQPHMAISPDGVLDAEYYRQIVDVILKATLPPEDYEPEVERIIVREVIIKVLLNDVIPKITQPWFIYRSILDLLGPSNESVDTAQPSVNTGFSFQTIVVVVLSALQSFSSLCLSLIHSYKQAVTTIKLVQQTSSPPSKPPITKPIPEPISVVPSASSGHSRPFSVSSMPSISSVSSSTPTHLPPAGTSSSTHEPITHHAPDYARRPLVFFAELTSASQRFTATLFFTILSMLATAFNPFLDRLLPYMLSAFLSPHFILNVVRTAKRTLFPNGYPGPQPPDPTLEEQAEIRARLVAWKGKGPASILSPLILGPDPTATLGIALEPLNNAQCNTRLLVFLLDRVLFTLFPELGGALL